MELKISTLPTILLLLMTLALMSCEENKSKVPVSPPIETSAVDTDVTYPNEQANGIDSSIISDLQQHVSPNAKGMSSNPNAVSNMPPYYEKGYEAGYDDGEDDAVHENGWQASYDDSNPYKGKKKSQYEDGYEEGYEAGYDDNNEEYEF